ncbi:phospholipid-transporting ATPase [Phytophthora nicotianae]|nr:phospholipid-transporting ATPase [Phytophthora nicotianae]
MTVLESVIGTGAARVTDVSVDAESTYRTVHVGESPVAASTGWAPKMLAEAAAGLGSSTMSILSAVSDGAVGDNSGALGLPETSARCIYVNNPAQNAAQKFCNNKVVTAKYTKFNFIPRFFYGRLSQVANFYFLLVGAGQIIPEISSTQTIPYQWIVLMLVLSIDAVFAAIEDRGRHIADAKMNARVSHIFDLDEPGCFRDDTWRNVAVGDIIKVENYEAIPADLLLLAVSEPDPNAPTGICFVETKSLDGETNLKVRQALSCTFSQLSDPRALAQLPGRVICEQPNHDVNNFSGRFEPQSGHAIPIDLKNVALRGCVIRNTPFIYGLVLNTGADTKIMQAGSHTPPTKISKILAIVNRGNALLMAILASLCILGAVLCAFWVAENREGATYLHLENLSGVAPFRNDVVGILIYLGYFWILIASFVPITLYVTIAIVKTYQTFFLNRDLGMYDEVTDTPALVRNSDLNDELGQVTHIFSDKTGTLTANEMDFRKMSIHGVSYGRGTTEIGREATRRLGKDLSASDVLADNTPILVKTDNVNFLDPAGDLERDSDARLHPEQAARIHDFFVHLAVCHSVVRETLSENDTGTGFSASSPDELALVSGANYFGYSFLARRNGEVAISVPGKREEVVYEVLEMVDFTSTRKRMSVVVRTPDKRIMLLTKGADSVIFPRLAPSSDSTMVDITLAHLERYATEGLRTLVIAQKELHPDAYAEWSCEYDAALGDLEQMAMQKRGEPNRIEELEEQLEQGLQLMGATAIEDRLQDQVTSTLGDLSRAGIKIWVLTGDKEETAVNIGFACQLLNNDMERIMINAETTPSASDLYDMLLARCVEARKRAELQASGVKDDTQQQAIVIDGRCLTMVFSNDVLSELFLEVSQQCVSVICCRVSPKQKAQVVRLFKTNLHGCRSLAIGDGANDVAMIQEAHIGVGISGHEGMQAVNASDFAIAQFRFLKRLLLVHGHWNYRRMAKLALYVVYKNILLFGTEFVLAALPQCGSSGTLYYNNMWINGYNVFWSSMPIGIVAITEQEVPARIAEQFPGLYHVGAQGELFSLRIFAQWVAEALYECVVCGLVPALIIGGPVDSTGNGFSRDLCGAISYCCLISVGWVKLALNMVTWNAITAFAFIASIIFWYISGYVIAASFPTSVADTAFPHIFALPEFYLAIFLSLLLCLGRDFLWKAYKREMNPEYYHILQEFHKRGSQNPEKARWTPPELRYERFQADLTEEKPRFDLPEQQALPNQRPSQADQKVYTGFAFSTQVLEDRFLNPLREMVLPVSQVANAIGRVLSPGGSPITRHNPDSPTRREATDEPKSFEEKILALPIEEQAVYEIQRYQVFTGWGSLRPGHLLITDPPKFTNALMTDGAGTFDLEHWVVDPGFGGTDQWQYATRFKDFLRAQEKLQQETVEGVPPELQAHASGLDPDLQERRRIKKKLNRLVGRSVRRRRWVRKEKLLAEAIERANIALAAPDPEFSLPRTPPNTPPPQ